MTEVNHDRSGGGESCCICWSQSRLEVASWLFGATAITFSKFLDAMSRLSYNPMSARVKYAWSQELCSWHLAATASCFFPSWWKALASDTSTRKYGCDIGGDEDQDAQPPVTSTSASPPATSGFMLVPPVWSGAG